MSSGFRFPPPPPPPPKAAADSNLNTPRNQPHGRGRGNARGRGRGQFHSNGQKPGGYPASYSQGQPTWKQSAGASPSLPSFPNATQQAFFPNPATAYHPYQNPLNATGVGQHRYIDHDTPGQHVFAPPQVQKRKHEALSYPSVEPKSKPEKKSNVETAPAVPMFGAPLPSATLPTHLAAKEKHANADPDGKSKRRRKKRETNQLGLTPAGEDRESSDEEIDEEAMFAALGSDSNGLLQFEHNGQVSTLTTTAEVKAWIEERRKKYPTKARVAERKARAEKHKQNMELARKRDLERARQRAIESQHKRVDKGKETMGKHAAKPEKLRQKPGNPPDSTPRSNFHNSQRSPTLKIEGVDKHEEIPHAKSESEDDEPPEEISLKMEASQEDRFEFDKVKDEPKYDVNFRLPTLVDNSGSIKSEEVDGISQDKAVDKSEGVSSDESSDISSTVSSGSDSESDSGFDSKTSSIPPGEVHVKREGNHKTALPKADIPRGVCHHFYLKGKCSRGRNCRYSHVKPGQHNKSAEKARNEAPKRQSLYQKLVAKEKEQENQAILQAIKLLGDNGLLDDEPQG